MSNVSPKWGVVAIRFRNLLQKWGLLTLEKVQIGAGGFVPGELRGVRDDFVFVAGICEDGCGCFGKIVWIRFVDQRAEIGVVYRFADSADIRRNDAKAAGESFEDDVGQTFVVTGKTEQIGGLHVAGDFGGRFATVHRDL